MQDGVFPYTGGRKNRRQRAAQRLRAQLEKGTKPFPSHPFNPKKQEEVPLTEGDRKRIQKELDVLTSRI